MIYIHLNTLLCKVGRANRTLEDVTDSDTHRSVS